MFGNPCEKYVPNPVWSTRGHHLQAARRPEQTPRPPTVLFAGSSGANVRCIAAGIACLWGPGTVVRTKPCLTCGKECGLSPSEYIKRAKDKNDSFKLMGFGHRVYKNFDPRAKLMRKVCGDVLNELGLQNDRLFKLAMELEKIALEDPYFVEKKLYPNVDFYSGIVQKAIGIPTEMFTCIFALARTVGWMTQWEEMITDPEYKIGRPRQLYIGAAKRDVVPLAQRG
jgi:citrate synthase